MHNKINDFILYYLNNNIQHKEKSEAIEGASILGGGETYSAPNFHHSWKHYVLRYFKLHVASKKPQHTTTIIILQPLIKQRMKKKKKKKKGCTCDKKAG